MPVNVGTVEAVLAARDTMSPVLLAAAERVVQLTNQLGNLGTTSVTEFNKLNAELLAAERRFEMLGGVATTSTQQLTASSAAALIASGSVKSLGDTSLATSASLKTLGEASVSAGEGAKKTEEETKKAGSAMDQVEGIAGRLIARMLILYAVRGTLDFVVGIFEAADAMVSLHDKTGLSISMLQDLQYMAEHTSVPFEKLTNAVQTLDKNLAEVKPSAVDALDAMGLSIDGLFRMSPDERLKTVIASISELPTQAQRSAAELKLFGTDAIDPLVEKFRTLDEEAKKAFKPSAESVQDMANADRQFKEMGTTLKNWAADLMWMGSKASEFLTTPFFVWWTTGAVPGTPEYRDVTRRNAPSSSADISGYTGMSVSVAGSGEGGPLLGQSFMDSVLNQTLKPLTAEQATWLGQLRESNILTTENAAHIGVTTEQLKLYTAQMRLADTAAKEEAVAEEDLMKMWDLAAVAQAASGEKGLKTKLEQLDRQETAEKDNWTKRFNLGKMGEETYWQGIEAIDEKYDAERKTARDKADEVEQQKWQENEDEIQKIRDRAAAIEDEAGVGKLDKKLALLAKQQLLEQDAFRKRLDAGKINEEQYWEAIYEIDRYYLKLQDATVHDAVRSIEEGAKPLEGPLKDFALYKPVFHDNLKDMITDTAELSKAFLDLGKVAGGSFGAIATNVGEVMGSLSIVAKGIDQYSKAQAPGQSNASYGAQKFAGALSAGAGFVSATDPSQGIMGIVGGAAAGAEIGSLFPGPGTAIGAGVGALVGLIRSVSGPSKDESTGRAVAGNFESQFASSRDMIEQVTYAYLQEGRTVEQAHASIHAMWDAEVRGADATKEAVANLNQVLDVHRQRIQDIKDALPQVADEFNDVAAAIGDDADSVESLGYMAQVAFSDAIASGKSWGQALAAVKPGLDILEKTYKDLGIDIKDAGTQALIMQEKIAAGSPKLITGIDALGKEFKTLNTLGEIDAQTFGDMERTGLTMYTRLQGKVAELGGGTRDALLPMQGFLHDAKDEADKLGVPLDDNLKILIEQSKELGIWRDTGADATSVLIGEMDKLIGKVSDLIEVISHTFDHMPSSVDVTVNHHDNYLPPTYDSNNGTFGRGGNTAHSGAYVRSGGFEKFHSGTGLASDEVVGILQTDESVLNRSATSALGYDTIRALNKGQFPGGFSGANLDPLINEIRAMRATNERLMYELGHTLPSLAFFAARDGQLQSIQLGNQV